MEKRCKYRKKAIIALWLIFVLWLVTGAIAEDIAVKERDVIEVQWKLIVFLVGIVQVLIGFIYIAGITSVKNSIRKLYNLTENLQKEKLDKEDHDRICAKIEK